MGAAFRRCGGRRWRGAGGGVGEVRGPGYGVGEVREGVLATCGEVSRVRRAALAGVRLPQASSTRACVSRAPRCRAHATGSMPSASSRESGCRRAVCAARPRGCAGRRPAGPGSASASQHRGGFGLRGGSGQLQLQKCSAQAISAALISIDSNMMVNCGTGEVPAPGVSRPGRPAGLTRAGPGAVTRAAHPDPGSARQAGGHDSSTGPSGHRVTTTSTVSRWAQVARSCLGGPTCHQPGTRRRTTHIRRFRHISVVDPGFVVDPGSPSTLNQPRSLNPPQ
jgi:hypothetical protein